MKKWVWILFVLFVAAATVSCKATKAVSEDAPAKTPAIEEGVEDEVMVKLGDTGYSMRLTQDFERITFFDIEGEEALDNLYGVYGNGKSYVIVYAGKAENTIEEETEILVDEIKTWEDYRAGTVNSIESLPSSAYESAAFDADIEWEDGEKENVKVLLVKCGKQGAVVYYFIPQGDADESVRREKNLSGELMKN